MHYSQGDSRLFYEKKALDIEAPLPLYTRRLHDGQRGRPYEFDWSMKHICRHGDPEKTLPSGRDSVDQGCQVYIRINKKMNHDRVEIKRLLTPRQDNLQMVLLTCLLGCAFVFLQSTAQCLVLLT
jgi:hypothetical protein